MKKTLIVLLCVFGVAVSQIAYLNYALAQKLDAIGAQQQKNLEQLELLEFKNAQLQLMHNAFLKGELKAEPGLMLADNQTTSRGFLMRCRP